MQNFLLYLALSGSRYCNNKVEGLSLDESDEHTSDTGEGRAMIGRPGLLFRPIEVGSNHVSIRTEITVEQSGFRETGLAPAAGAERG